MGSLRIDKLSPLTSKQPQFSGFESNIKESLTLAERFLVPPFSVLDARQGYWQDRKREWLSIGIKSEEGRKYDSSDKKMVNTGRMNTIAWYKEAYDKNEKFSESDRKAMGVYWAQGDSLIKREAASGIVAASIFDPVLCELVYRWFSPPAGSILDPFAGGSVRGIVASVLGRQYYGVDLSEAQIAANITQAEGIIPESMPTWLVGDSTNADSIPAGEYDLVFTRPPYHNLEIYTDNPKDLSNMTWEGFSLAYEKAITNSVKYLKDNRFTVFVVGDLRDPKGFYKGFPQLTINILAKLGMPLYNDCVLVTPVGSLPVRTKQFFNGSRKIAKSHQNVLVFIKGDPKIATRELGVVNLESIL